MRYRSPLPRILVVGIAAVALAGGLLTAQASAVPTPTPSTSSTAASQVTTAPHPVRPDTGHTTDFPDTRSIPTPAKLRGAPVSGPRNRSAATSSRTAPVGAGKMVTKTPAAVTSCTTADFANRTGSALVAYIKSVDPYTCINPLYGLTGTDAHGVFQESQMLAVANGVTSTAYSYPGDDSTGVRELLNFLQAGYYVQSYHSSDVGTYDSALTSAVEYGLNTLFGNPNSNDVSSGNGDVLQAAITVTDSAQVQGDYLGVYKRYLNAYNSSWDTYSSMDAALNTVYTPLWRGNWNPAFVAAVTADPSIVDTLNTFALNYRSLLGGDWDVLDSNAGNDLARMLGITALQTKIRPLAAGLLNASSITGQTASLWVHVAYQASQYDGSQCSYYGTCDLSAKLTAASLPITYSCSNFTIMAQSLTAQQQTDVCNSLRSEVPYFTNLDSAGSPIPGEYFAVKMVIYGSKNDYATYSWAIFGNSTDNGGETLTGNPADPNNIAYSILYQQPNPNGFTANAWNLNHEFTHILQSIYDMKGDFSTQESVNDVWWIEGQAEYVSYTYRGVTDTQALTEAAKHTYRLSTLFQNNYTVDDVTRTYPWGYLAVRYMFERHPAVITAMLSHFRTGDYTGGYAVYNNLGTAYDDDFDAWLTSLASGGAAPCTDPNVEAMGQNCSRANQSAATGNTDYFWIYMPAGTTTLSITTTGGTGNADLYYNASTWATPTAYTAKSTNSGNTESITVTNTTAGYRYISLYAATEFSGVTVTTKY